MNDSTRTLHILIFASQEDDGLRYQKLLKHIYSLKNNISHSATLVIRECKQEWNEDLGQQFGKADIALLILSASFVGFPRYQEQVEIALQKHSQGKTHIIPILFSSVVWEDSRLGTIQSLPRNHIPISRLSSPDDALRDIAEYLGRHIKSILKDRGYPEPQEEEYESDDAHVPSTAFNWTDIIPPANYLTFTGKNSEDGFSRRLRLRLIMRIVYNMSGERVGEQEIWRRVQQESHIDYDFHDCLSDLKYLVDHMNLVPVDDMTSMATSIAAFNDMTRRSFYDATDDGFEIEKLIENRMQAGRARLNKSDLHEIKQRLFEIDAYMTRQNGLKQDDEDAIEDKWGSLFATWERSADNSRNYLFTLTRIAQSGQYDFEQYMAYKSIVTTYVQSFANMLLDISHEVNELLAGWSQKKEWLIQLIAESAYRKELNENRTPLETLVERTRSQMTSLETWFREKAHAFYERAGSEIHRLVNRATALALYHRSKINTVSTLQELALALMKETHFEQAQQLFEAALSHVLPLHLSENLAGHAQIYEQAEMHVSVWDEPAPARPVLISAKPKNGTAPIRRLEDPIAQQSQEHYNLQAQELRKEVEDSKRFFRLFEQPTLSLDTLNMIDPPDRTLLEEIIDTCLSRSNCQYEDDMGNKAVLLNRDEKRYIHLFAQDGILFLPRYQLQRLPAQGQTE